MTEKIDLQPAFAMNNGYMVKNIKECFDVLNKLLIEKSGVSHEPLFIREERSNVRVGYKPNHSGTAFYSDVVIPNDAGAMDRAILIQFVIFEGCKSYGCYSDVPMAGAPEEGHDAFFTFTYDGTEYTYTIWTKS
jgi:hypothetical protein